MPPVRKTSNHAPVQRSKAEDQALSVNKKAGRTVTNTGERFHLLKSLWRSIVNFFTCLKNRLIQSTEPTVSIRMGVLNNDTQRHLSQVINALATGDCEQFLASTSAARIALQQQTGDKYDLGHYIGELTNLFETIKDDQHTYDALVTQLSNSAIKQFSNSAIQQFSNSAIQHPGYINCVASWNSSVETCAIGHVKKASLYHSLMPRQVWW
ncbi:hypothetical protein [Kistimonas scapharcae]|uniref:hypothetical protein n=1 Tax=Kistimonas scapharcae TaxID=1036133 RepID=UPI0031E5F1B6